MPESQAPSSKVGVPIAFDRYKQNPAMCGIYGYQLLMDAQGCSLEYANKFKAVIPCAHLVNAVHQEKFCSLSWPELARMVDIQTEKHVFIGAHPETVQHYNTNMQMVLGQSVVEFAAKKRKTKQPAKREKRNRRDDLPIASLLKDFMSRGVELDLAKIERLLNRVFEPMPIEEQEVMARSIGVYDMSANYYHAGVHPRISTKPGISTGKSGPTIALTPEQLFAAFSSVIQADVSKLHFDYFRLHRKCWSLLDRIATGMDDELKLCGGANWAGATRNLRLTVVPLILKGADKEVKLAQKNLKTREADQVRLTLLVDAGKIVEQFLMELKVEHVVSGGSCGMYYRH